MVRLRHRPLPDKMHSVNVLVTDVPGACGTLCLQVGVVSTGVALHDVMHALSERTGLPCEAFRLRAGGRVICETLVAQPGQRDAYVALQLCRALPGGKGGFGANLRGAAAAKKTSNFAACRDLNGRRLRDVERASAIALLEKDGINSEKGVKRPRANGVVESASAIVQKEVMQKVTADVDVDDIADAMRANESAIDDDLRIGRRAARLARKRRRVSAPPTVMSPPPPPPPCDMEVCDDSISD